MKVELVGKTFGVGKYKTLNDEEIIAAIARHGVIKEDNGKLVKYLMDNEHWSPLDMINYVFEIETSRAIGRQLIRHTSIKVQEFSQRYSDDVKFEPVELRREHAENRQSSTETFDPPLFTNGGKSWLTGNECVEGLLDTILIYYKELIKAGVAKECARMILPECTQTTITMNGTLRSWLSFLNVRMDEHAQKECKQIAEQIGTELMKALPNVFSEIDWMNGKFM